MLVDTCMAVELGYQSFYRNESVPNVPKAKPSVQDLCDVPGPAFATCQMWVRMFLVVWTS